MRYRECPYSVTVRIRLFTLVDLSSKGREFQILEFDIETLILNVHMLYKFTHFTYHGIGQLFTTFFHRNPI